MTVQELLTNWLVPLIVILGGLAGLWKLLHDRATALSTRVDAVERQAQAATQSIRIVVDQQIRDLEKQLHAFQLESAKAYCSITTISQMEDRFSGQFKSLGENMESVRERVDALFDKFIEKSGK